MMKTIVPINGIHRRMFLTKALLMSMGLYCSSTTFSFIIFFPIVALPEPPSMTTK